MALIGRVTSDMLLMGRGKLLAGLCLLSTMLFQQQAVAGVVAWWRFENGTSGQPATGDGSILDSSGNGLNGSPVLGPTYTNSVSVASIPLTGHTNLLSMSFNGQSNRVTIPDYPQLAITNNLTLEAFFLARGPAGGPFSAGQIIWRGDDRGGLDPYGLFQLNSHIEFSIENASGNYVKIATPDVTFNVWHHVAGTLDGATGTMRLYLDGILMATTTTTIRPFASLTGPLPGLGIGSDHSGNASQYFNGLIDEVRVSDTALLPSQFLSATTPSLEIGLYAGATAGLTIHGATGQTYQIQCATDLVASNWVTWTNFFLQQSPVLILDPDSTNMSWRFYRLAQ